MTHIVNTEQLRQSLKHQWLTYYRDNRPWLTRLGVWVDCAGKRRPSSGFILGVLSSLDPQLPQMLPLIVDLSNNPDRIVMALGLNFNPDEELKAFEANGNGGEARLLPAGEAPLTLTDPNNPNRAYSRVDETCRGAGRDSEH